MEISCVTRTSAAEDQTATIFVALVPARGRAAATEQEPMAGCGSFAERRQDQLSWHRRRGHLGAAGVFTPPCGQALIGRYRRQAEEHLKRPIRVVSCYEAGYDGFWLHRLLQARGIENHVMDPASLPVDRRARRAKTDRLDLGALLRTLMAWWRSEPQVCRMVRVPSLQEEDRRRQTRERERLI
jgi:transposase